MGKKILIGLGTLVVLIGIVVAVVLGHLGRLIERGVETAGPQITGTDVSLGSARVSIFSGEGSLHRLHIGNPAGFSTDRAFDLGEIAIAIDPKSVASKVIHVRSVVVEAPQLVAEFDATGHSNLDKIMEHVRGAAGGGGSKGSGDSGGSQTKLIIDEFRFEGAEVRALAPAFKVDKTLKLQPVILKNLGAKQGGAAASDIANQVMRPIVDEAVRAATQEYLNAQRDKLGDKAKEKLLDRLFK
jgi:uncharacterized protein involved in outer membrane biogenesis